MDTIEFAKQYTNKELAAKWENNIPLSELNERYELATDSQDIDYVCMLFPFLPKEDISGVVHKIGDGNFDEVYITESSRPFDLSAIYHPLEYYV